jgi:ribonuclease Z
MKPTMHHRPVNGPFEDPSVYVRFLRERRAMLFDAGDISGLGQAETMKLTDLFITHTHIDHFIGFDAVLRALLRRERPLRIYGPSNITDCVEGKLRGYAWNLIEEYPLRLEVFAVHENSLRHTIFVACERFERRKMGERPFSGVLLDEAGFKVRAASLNHDIHCLGFSIEEDYHININKQALTEMGLEVGPWLNDFKKAIRENAPENKEFQVSGRLYTMEELRPLAMFTDGQKISYITDASPDEENEEKIINLVQGSDTLYCEAYFLEEERDKAMERKHLTGKIAGKIARLAGVKNLVPMHYSPRYMNSPVTPGNEAMEEYLGSSPL